MSPQALHNAVHGLLLPLPQPGPELPTWALWLIAILAALAVIIYPWSRK